jgi:hypothetical protein
MVFEGLQLSLLENLAACVSEVPQSGQSLPLNPGNKNTISHLQSSIPFRLPL